MRSLDDRVAALEAADLNRRSQGRLVLIAPHGLLTDAQRARAEATRCEGGEVLVIELVALGPAPENTRKEQG
jgi:hypothetical protein